ncbi:hypothetical protein [Odoribacter splanchnicus]|jgi:hypothetical protein|uniref:HIRAN domain-containing protein n=3 Tax=Odoribacter splanchnicus TaxID=28118 RepID=A0AAW6FDL1_9BACT|nr:hypothetical protein [Odoribacter splanchnicus]MDB9208145.1 hypothetical protein [Odoribacter splanchnicus]MDB9215584.1 hypothetical protein [Odoribacter splanchnicus]MDB9221801.1 hypothetical protein [Odoribacter splanchnicus]
MEILFTVVVIIIVVYALLKDTIIYIVQCYKYKYLAAGVFFRHLQNKRVSPGYFEGYIIRDQKNIFDENAIAIFNSYHTMLGYVAAKETYLFLPLFEYENRIFIKGVIYPKKNIVLYKVCPDIDINDKIEEDSLPVNNSDELLRGEIVNISRDITSKTIPNEAFLGKLSKNKDIIEAYFKNKYLGTVRKNKIKFITPFLDQTGNCPCMLIAQKGESIYDFYIDYIICNDPAKLEPLIDKYNRNPILFNTIQHINDKK